MKVREIVEAVRGKLVSGDPDITVKASGISADSRSLGKGDLFIALSGANFDGNDFVSDAFKKGAIGAVVRAPWRGKRKAVGRKAIIEVKDTTKALQDIAHHHRMKFDIPVIGVTGSSGKTTVKEIIGSVLSSGYNVLKNEGTKNNHIGVPQTLLKLNKGHDICVIEMGTNHPGEIRLLAGIAKPTAAVITNIGPSHLEFLKDLKGVFDAKREMLEHLADSGLLILNGDDPFLSRIKDARFDIVKFGFGRNCDVRASSVNMRGKELTFAVNGVRGFMMKTIGEHDVYNALAAIAVASSFGVKPGSVKKALARHAPAGMRLNLITVRGIDIINDSYN
ncbi:MAG: UDP-N-acetylmuramoyl-tripeptide--D-alanyl-D-alanine ligase, partial [Candidatus Omnitrophota bacterium]